MRIAFVALLLAASAQAAWHPNLKDGLAAAKKSGKPLFVATLWKKGI